MGIKIDVREGETIEKAIGRLERLLIRDRGSEKWPYSHDAYIKPSVIRHRKNWLKRVRHKNALRLLRKWGMKDWCGTWQRELAKKKR